MRTLPATSRKLLGIFFLGLLMVPFCSYGLYSQPDLPELESRLPAHPEYVLERTAELIAQATRDNQLQLEMQAHYVQAIAYQVMSAHAAMEQSVLRGLDIARQINDTGYISQFLWLEAEILDVKGNWGKANSNLENAIALALSTGDERLIGMALLARSRVLSNQYQAEAALKDLMQANEIFQRNQDKEYIGVTLSDIALIYQSTGDIEKAIEYFLESMKYDEADDLYTAVINHINLGDAYTDADKPVLAEQHLRQAIKIANELGDQNSLAFAVLRLGDLKSGLKQYEQALYLFEQALGYFILQQDRLMEFNSRLSVAATHVKLNNAESARKQLDEAEAIAQQLGLPQLTLHLQNTLADYYLLEERPGSAVETLRKQLKLTAELYEKAHQNKLDELKIRFNTVQNEVESELLLVKLQEQQTRHRLYLAIMILVVLILSITLWAYLKQRSANRKLANLAMMDELTGVANRRHILTLARNELDRAKRYNSSLVLAIIDLDHFKQINDRYGHHMGDQVLKIFARLCHDNIRKPDKIGRIGGEEWLLVFPSVTQNQVLPIIERVRELYATAHPEGLPRDHPLTFCAGISEYLPTDVDVGDIIVRADRAQYAAKSAGRNRVMCDNVVHISKKTTDIVNESIK